PQAAARGPAEAGELIASVDFRAQPVTPARRLERLLRLRRVGVVGRDEWRGEREPDDRQDRPERQERERVPAHPPPGDGGAAGRDPLSGGGYEGRQRRRPGRR